VIIKRIVKKECKEIGECERQLAAKQQTIWIMLTSSVHLRRQTHRWHTAGNDVIKLKKVEEWVDPADTTYLGDGFAASITYDYNFVNYNGYARTFYVHTWQTAQISSITFGGSGTTFGVNISITNSQYSFKAFNGSDATF